MRTSLRSFALLGVAACGGGGTDAPPDAGRPPPICRDAVTLGQGPYFTDVTDQWFPDGVIGGNRFTLADLDGDGRLDLVTHPVAATRPRLDEDPPVLTWHVYRNIDGTRFEDRSAQSGFGAARDGSPNRSANFSTAGDFDNDGDLDLFSGVYADLDAMGIDNGDRNDLFLNDGTGLFARAPAGALGQTSLPWHTIGTAPLDYDRDGNLDVYVGFWYEVYGGLTGQQDRLYRGDGAGRFTEVTLDVGLGTTPDGFAEGTNHRATYGVSACDVDDDGDLDLLGSAYGRAWNQELRNDGGAFQDVARDTGFYMDELVDHADNQFYRCWCQSNPGACDPSIPAPVIACGNYWAPGVDDQPWRAGGNTFTTACGDADNDGDLDLYNAEIRHWHIGTSSDEPQLLVNEPDPTLGARWDRPGTAATGMAWPHATTDWNEGGLMATFLDFDLDGNLDVFVANSDYPDTYGLLYRGRGDGTFEEIAGAAGVDHPCTSGLAAGDLDGDGDQDLIVGSGTARSCGEIWSFNEVHVYRNDVGQDGNALRLTLVGGAGSNRAAIGARVRATSGGRTIRRDVQGSFGHMAIGNDLTVFVGLAGECEADVEVRWPDAAGTIEVYEGVRANYAVELVQGGGAVYR